MAASALLAPGPALARRQARAILAEARFHEARVPRPLHGVLHAIGRALDAPLEAIEGLVGSAGGQVPGGEPAVWGLLAALVLGLAGVLAARRSRHALGAVGAARAEDGEARLSARALEREAVAAEREQRHGEAVRLRFRAGLQRLAEREVVALVASTPNAQVARALGSERFDRLARAFDEIAYGGRAASEADAASARREWRELLGSARALAGPLAGPAKPHRGVPRAAAAGDAAGDAAAGGADAREVDARDGGGRATGGPR